MNMFDLHRADHGSGIPTAERDAESLGAISGETSEW